jgi:hypothetical protein
MSGPPKSILLASAVLLLLSLTPISSRAGFVTTVTPSVTFAGGLYTYSYNVMNSPTSTVGVSEFDVSVDPGANLGSLTNPSGFLALYTTGDPAVEFLSTDPTFDIAPGASGLFSFTSMFGPTTQADLVRGFDTTMGTVVENAGSTLAPVPEASSVVLFGLGLASMIGFRARSLGSRSTEGSSAKPRLRLALAVVAAGLAPVFLAPAAAWASDHADTAANFNRLGADLTDLYIFPNPANANNVVLVMNSHGLIPAGQGANIGFDPQVLYQFKIDNTGDFVEDLVIQFRFIGAPPNQMIVVSGPLKPYVTGTTSIFARPYANIGTINQLNYSPTPGMKVFAGVRSESFFLDLNRFNGIFPDRATPLTGQQVDFPSIMAADTPQINGFRGFPANSGFDSTPAADFLANLNVMSIVTELPKAMLGNGVIHVWMTTSIPSGPPAFTYIQQDRLARPLVNEVLATVTNRRHEINNKINPTDDAGFIATDIAAYMNFPAGRSPAVTNALLSVLIPDTMTADLSQNVTTASYLGHETGGFGGASKFGGRALADDVVDISLQAVFGKLLTTVLGLAPDDGVDIVQFTTDNVGPHTDYQNVFPYLGDPH